MSSPPPTPPDDTEDFGEFSEFDADDFLPFDKRGRKVEYPEVEARRVLTKAEKAKIIARQEGKCAGCSVKPRHGWEFDHIDPLWRGSTDQADLDTWQAFGSREDCQCHVTKTSAEAGDRAKRDRCRGESGQVARRKRHGSFFKKPEGYVSPLNKNSKGYRR